MATLAVVVSGSSYHCGRMATSDRNGRTAEWLRPRLEQQGLQRYVNTIRERIKLIIAITLLTTGAAVAYVLLASKEYEASADMLVTPAPSDDPATNGLPLIKTSSDPTRDVETAARLIVNRDVALRVKTDLKLDDSAPNIKNKVKAEPVAQSNIVAITATADSPR
ncbi:MAG: hypothetical protein QOD53_1570, partial [Thermoleophilaceae bacterium]|nr:hypothetical protein [Thermoleophilaceae bacterium]